jgi:hypothetical protein
MSLSLDKLTIKQCVDPRLDFNDSYRDYVVQKGAQQTQIVNFRSPSSSNSSQSITINVPNLGTVMDRQVWIEIPITVSFVNTGASTPLQAYFDAPRAYALSSIIQTLNATIGQFNCTIPLSDVVQPLSRVNVKPLQNQSATLDAIALDKRGAITTAGGVVQYAPAGLANNSGFALYSDNPYQLQRGAFLMNITANAGNAGTAQLVLRERLFLSPFSWSDHNDHGIVGIQQCLLNMTFMPNLSYLWSHADSATQAGWNITGVNLGQMNCYVKFLTPKTLTSIPRQVFYNYYTVNRYLQSYNNTIVNNAIGTFTSNNIILTAIPDMILICARPARSQVTSANVAGTSGPAYVPDTYLGACQPNFFTNPNAQGILNVTWNAQSNVFSEYTCGDLFTMSKHNGYFGEFPEWSGVKGIVDASMLGANQYAGSGSVIVIRSTDLPLADGQSAGLLQNTNLNITYSALNNTGQTIPSGAYELCVVVVYPGVMEIRDSEVYASFAPLTTKDVLDSEKAPVVSYRHVEHMFGGSFLGNLVSGLKKVLPLAHKYAPQAKEFLGKMSNPYAKKASSFLGAVGYGKKRHHKRRGMGLTGGRMGKKGSLRSKMLRGAGKPESDSECDSQCSCSGTEYDSQDE